MERSPATPPITAMQLGLANKHKQRIVSTGNESLDDILGGGLVRSTVNILECANRHSVATGKMTQSTFASNVLSNKGNLIVLVCDQMTRLNEQEFLATLPLKTRVKSENLYKDLVSKSASTRIKIAWRYTNLSSPSDRVLLVDQADFGVQLKSDKDLTNYIKEFKLLKILHLADFANVKEAMKKLVQLVDEANNHGISHSISPQDRSCMSDVPKKSTLDKNSDINVLVMNLTSPLSLVDTTDMPSFMFTLRCLTRSRKNCTCLVTIYSELILASPFPIVLERLYNLSDGIVKLSSFVDMSITPYVDYNGIAEIIKTAKINSTAYHYEKDVCDWGFRITKNNRFLVFDKLSLPPCDEASSKATEVSLDYKQSGAKCSTSETSKLEF